MGQLSPPVGRGTSLLEGKGLLLSTVQAGPAISHLKCSYGSCLWLLGFLACIQNYYLGAVSWNLPGVGRWCGEVAGPRLRARQTWAQIWVDVLEYVTSAEYVTCKMSIVFCWVSRVSEKHL